MVCTSCVTLPVFVLKTFAPVKLIPEMLTPLKSPLDKSTPGPTIYPFDNWYLIFTGSVVVVNRVCADPVTLPEDVFVNLALIKVLPVISAPLKFPFVKLYPLMSRPGPIMYRAVTLYPGGSDAGVPAIFSDRIRARFDPLNLTPDKSTPVIVISAKLEPVKSTPGPTMYPFKYLYPYSDPYDAPLENVIGLLVNI